jgi:hypothetical protein
MLHGCMDDVLAALKDRRIKAEAKVVRARKALELAKKELEDIEAAERVFASISGESTGVAASQGGVSERDRVMTKLLATEASGAQTPAELHQIYLDETGDDVNLDAFRTALWRLQKKEIRGVANIWVVRSEGGRYWRESPEGDVNGNDTGNGNANPY